jgi:hypothetical protein
MLYDDHDFQAVASVTGQPVKLVTDVRTSSLYSRIYAQLARMLSMSGRMRSRARSRGTPDISRES